MSSDKNSAVKDLTVGDPARLILFFTLPLLAGNIFQQLYGFVDTLIVGCTGQRFGAKDFVGIRRSVVACTTSRRAKKILEKTNGDR